jgi:hypothetical protein
MALRIKITDIQFELETIHYQVDNEEFGIVGIQSLYEFAENEGLLYYTLKSKDPTDETDGEYSLEEFESNHLAIDYEAIIKRYIHQEVTTHNNL